MGVAHKTWYFIEPKSKLADVYNILHLPYTAMALSIVLAGAATAPVLHVDRTLGALLAYFFGLGLGAHALDQLEPHGSHYVERLTPQDLALIGTTGLFAGVATGLYFAFTVSLWLVPFIVAGAFFAVAYTLPSVAGGLFHNNLSFSFSWGFLPFVTSYFANSLSLSPVGLTGGVLAALAAFAEIRLSRRSRLLRKVGASGSELKRTESRLKSLVVVTCAVSLLVTTVRIV